MKPTLHVDSLHLTIRGVPAETATAAVRGLGPALTRELGAGQGAPGDGAAPPRVSRDVSESRLRGALAARVAAALQPHLRPHR